MISDDDRRFLSQLARLREPTIQALCGATGVTATAVRHRLARLLEAELVEKRAEVRGRGRPAHFYRLTSAGRNQLGDNSTRLAALLWQQVMQIESDAIREQVIEGVREGLAEDLATGITGQTPEERLAELGSRLQQTGFDVAVDETGDAPTLKEHCCPYHSVAGQSMTGHTVAAAAGEQSAGSAVATDGAPHQICQFEEQVFSSVVGAPVRITQHCSTGGGCCEFELVELGASGETLTTTPARPGGPDD